MRKHAILWFFGGAFILLVATVLLYRPLIRPWHARWGAADAEVAAALSGDEVLSGPVEQTTRAITIAAQPAQIYPWLLQLGQGRGGMFSYDWLENLAGCDIHTLDHIVPALQTLKVGDAIRLGPQETLPYYTVVILEPEKTMLLRSVNPTSGEPGETWGFYLQPAAGASTRLIIRHRTPPSQGTLDRVVNGIFEPISFMMEHRMLHGLRDHAETLARTASK